jgi:hypothetical protein
MPRSSLDRLPPYNSKKFREAIKRGLEVPLCSLTRFSDSVRAGRAPAWPPDNAYSLFIAQLREFRIISKRKDNAPPIQLMREINHRWPKLKVVRTVENCVEELKNYLGRNLIGTAIAKARFESLKGRVHDDQVSLLLILRKKRFATPADLEVIHDLLPEHFQKLTKLASKDLLRSANGAPSDAVEKLRISVARSAQEYLISEHALFSAKIAAANALRKFIHGLKYPPYTKKLFGFSAWQINEWDKADLREASRLRKKKFDNKNR